MPHQQLRWWGFSVIPTEEDENMKKTYYVVGTPDCPNERYRNLTGPNGYVNTLEQASKFNSIPALTLALQERTRRSGGVPFGGCQIIRVTEEQGEETRVLLKDTEAAPSGSTVKFALASEDEFLKDPSGVFDNWTSDHSKIMLYRTHFAALEDWSMRKSRQYSFGASNVRLVRIAVVPGAPKVTTTVLE